MPARQAVDREAVIDALKAFRGIVRNQADQEGDPAHFANRILALMSVGGVARELEWEDSERYANLCWSRTPIGEYSISLPEDADAWLLWVPGGRRNSKHPTENAAKAAAQAHYNDAISKAVKPGPDVSGLAEALEKMLDAIKTGNIDSPEIDLGDPDIPPFRFHEEWAHRARQELATFKGGEDVMQAADEDARRDDYRAMIEAEMMTPTFKPRYIIEAEKAGADAERERLAKVAEEKARECAKHFGTHYGKNDEHWFAQEAIHKRTAAFIRSQGEDK